MVRAWIDGPITARSLLVLGAMVLGGLLVMGVVSGTPAAVGADDTTSVDRTAAPTMVQENVTEEEYVEPAPERGDEYYEATDPDGNWISYINPRDEYRDPYLGDASGKICVTLLNEAGEPIVGETVPNTTVTVPTGETIEWHSHADPMVVEYPLTDNYERPLDADQFGTSPDVPQGDGYMDSHCIEIHGPREDATIEYGEAQIEGEHADDIEVVGYVQQANTPGWDTSVDPIEDAESYEEVGGGWTYRPGASHGQVVAVLQLDRDSDELESENETTDETTEETESTDDTDENGTDTTDDGDDDELPGFGATVAIAALTIAAIVVTRR